MVSVQAIYVPVGVGGTYLLGATGEVCAGLGHIGEHAGGLDDEVSAHLPPGDLGRVLAVEHADGAPVDKQDVGAGGIGLALLVVGRGGGAGQAAVDGVILEHVRHVVGRDERVVDGHHLHVVTLQGRAHHQAADAAEAVDTNLQLGLGGACSYKREKREWSAQGAVATHSSLRQLEQLSCGHRTTSWGRGTYR